MGGSLAGLAALTGRTTNEMGERQVWVAGCVACILGAVAWSFQGSWVILTSGTAVGLSLIAWSLHRTWQQRRQEPVATTDLQADSAGQPPPLPLPVATASLGRQGGGNDEPPESGTMYGSENEATLFALRAGMYELKGAAEELPPVQIPRRAVRRQVAEQLLLWPDADEPRAGAVRPSDFTTTERR